MAGVVSNDNNNSITSAHLPLDKMAAILADDIFNCIFLKEIGRIRIQISLKYVPRSPIDNKQTLVQAMAWRQTCAKPPPEAMMSQFIDAYMWHNGDVSYSSWCWGRNIPGDLGKYHSCGCPGSLRRQDISSFGIGYIGQSVPWPPWWRISIRGC